MVRIELKLTKELADQLEEHATRVGVRRNELIRRILSDEGNLYPSSKPESRPVAPVSEPVPAPSLPEPAAIAPAAPAEPVVDEAVVSRLIDGVRWFNLRTLCRMLGLEFEDTHAEIDLFELDHLYSNRERPYVSPEGLNTVLMLAEMADVAAELIDETRTWCEQQGE